MPVLYVLEKNVLDVRYILMYNSKRKLETIRESSSVGDFFFSYRLVYLSG